MDRRRAAIAMSPAVEDDDRARKRRKQSDESVSPQTVFDTVWNHKERNRNIRQHFEELPSKDVYPDYYVKITDPISLYEIQKKLSNEGYAGVTDIQKDLIRMVDNATIYNKAKSQVHSDALRLRSVIESFNVDGGDDPNGKIKREPEVVGRTPRGSRAGPPPIRDAQVQIIDDLLALTDANGEVVSYHFKTLPARKSYPDYYQVIQQPISLNQIRSRAKDGTYRTWAEFEEAVYLIRKNAEQYNDEASEIVKDARALEGHFTLVLQKQKTKHGDAPSGLKLRFNIGGRTAAQPAPKTLVVKTPATKTSAPKIRLHMKKEPAPQTPVMAPAVRTNGVPKTVPPKPPVDRRSPPKAQAAPVSASTPVPVAAPVTAPVPVAQRPPTKTVSNNVVSQEAPVMKRSDSVTSPTPMSGIIMNGTAITPNDTIVVSKTPSLTPQPPTNNVMPPPVQRLSTTPRPSFSPIPSMASPAPPPMQQIPYTRPLYQYDEPRFRPEGKDASSALISSLCISSISALNPEEKYIKTLHPDDQKVTSQFYLHLPAEYHTISATPTLSAELMEKLYRLSIDVKFNNSPPKSIPMINSGASKKTAEPQFETIRLVPGVVNTLECMVVTEARRPDGTMAGWELERYRVFMMLLP